MSRSVLLQLARDSIEEVFEARRTIQRSELLKEHPLLHEKVALSVNIYLENRLRGSHSSLEVSSLLEAIVLSAKKAAFEDKNFTPLKTSEYLHCEIEIILQTDDGPISQKDTPILNEKNARPEYVFKENSF